MRLDMVWRFSKTYYFRLIPGIAEAVQNRDKKYWCLTCELLQRGMTKNHVTLFWHLYGDTMGPVSRNMVRFL